MAITMKVSGRSKATFTSQVMGCAIPRARPERLQLFSSETHAARWLAGESRRELQRSI
jgi:hypothetical protein